MTGATSGIGREIALKLARAGARVLAVGRRQQRLDQLVEEFSASDATSARPVAGVSHDVKGAISPLSGDLTLAEDRQRWVDWCQACWGGLDLLIHNAGAGAIGRFDSSPPDRLRKLMEVDFFGPVELTRLCLPLLETGRVGMMSRTGKPAIVIIGSVLAHRAVPLKSDYCAAKFAMRGWAESLRCELAGQGIEVLQIDPSTTRSEFLNSMIDTPVGTKSRSIGSMSSESVAKLTVRAIERSQRRVILSLGGRALVSASRWIPSIVDRILSK